MDKVFTALMIAASAGLFVYANAVSLRWAKTGEIALLLIVTAASVVGYFCFAKVSEQRGIAIASALIDSTIVIGTVVTGYFVFGETFSPRQVTGLSLAVAAILLLL